MQGESSGDRRIPKDSVIALLAWPKLSTHHTFFLSVVRSIKLTVPASWVREYQIVGAAVPRISSTTGVSADLRLIKPLPGMQVSVTGDGVYVATYFQETTADQLLVNVNGDDNSVQVDNVANIAVKATGVNASALPNRLSVWTPTSLPPSNVNVEWRSSNGRISVAGMNTSRLVMDLSQGTGNTITTGIPCDNVVDSPNGNLFNNECRYWEMYGGGGRVYFDCLSSSVTSSNCNYNSAATTTESIVAGLLSVVTMAASLFISI